MNPELQSQESESHQAAQTNISPQLERINFQSQAEDMSRTLNNQLESGMDEKSAYAAVEAIYVKEEDDPDLKKFSQLLLSSAQFFIDEKWLNQYRDEIGDRKPNIHERQHLDRLKQPLLQFNSRLRELLLTNDDDKLTFYDLKGWLQEFGKADEDTVNRVLLGVGAEVGVAKAAKKLDFVRSVMSATPSQDAEGVDIIVRFHGNHELGIDTKYGQNQAMMKWQPTRRGIELGIEPEELSGFSLTKDGREFVQDLLTERYQRLQKS